MTSHLSTAAEKEAFTALILSACSGFCRLQEILEEDLQGIETAMESRSYMDKDSWAFHHASVLGEKRVYSRVINILKSITEEE